jgi:CBS-domain-containing membrane protein
MKREFAALSHVPLDAGTTFVSPPDLPYLVHLDSPAADVMTNFEFVRPVTTSVNVRIDDALEHMKSSGVRLLLVTDDENRITGLITAKDLQGERPIKIVQEDRVPRSQITVGMIMTRQSAITVLNMVSVRSAQVGHILESLHELERQHALVVDVDDTTGRQKVHGMFSTTQIYKQLGKEVTEEVAPAHSLAEMVHDAG